MAWHLELSVIEVRELAEISHFIKYVQYYPISTDNFFFFDVREKFTTYIWNSQEFKSVEIGVISLLVTKILLY